MDTEPHTGAETPEEAETPAKKGAFARYWEKVGGGSFTISLVAHILFAVIAVLIIWRTQSGADPENIEFLSGGGGGTDGNTQINQKKQRMMVNRAPAMKLSAVASNSAISIPDTQSTIADMSNLVSNSGMMSGTPGSGGGFGGGKGTGRGTGIGPGFGPGSGAGFTASFLGLVSSGNNIIFCIDTSGSMRTNLKDEGIDAVRRELKRVISGLPPNTSFNLICFGTDGDIFKEKSVPASTENKNEATRFLDGYYGRGSVDFGRTRTEYYKSTKKNSDEIKYIPLNVDDVKELAGTEGGSRIDLAMVAAFARKPTTIYVLSDGAPGTKEPKDDGPMDKRKLIDLIYDKYKAIMGSTTKLQVNTISIFTGDNDGKEGEKFLKDLARKFDGKHSTVKPDKLKDSGNAKEPGPAVKSSGLPPKS